MDISNENRREKGVPQIKRHKSVHITYDYLNSSGIFGPKLTMHVNIWTSLFRFHY